MGRSETTGPDNPITTAVAAPELMSTIDKLPYSGPSICSPSRTSGTGLVSALGEDDKPGSRPEQETIIDPDEQVLAVGVAPDEGQHATPPSGPRCSLRGQVPWSS